MRKAIILDSMSGLSRVDSR